MLGVKSKVLEYLKRFCNETSVHGLFYIFKEKRWSKLFWITIFSLLFASTLYLCTDIIIGYYKKKIASIVTYDRQIGYQFPHMLFCKQFALSKRKVKGNDAILLANAGFMAEKWEKVGELFTKNLKYCRKNISTIGQDSDLLDAATKLTAAEFLHLTCRDSFDSVVKCWWNGSETECNGIFRNIILNDGPCFGIIQNLDVVKQGFETGMIKLSYGVNLSRADSWIANSTRPDSTARFLLDVGEYDSCDAAHGYSGSGFKVFITDITDAFPVDNVLPRISLMPGYRIDVVIRPILFNRQTEHLHKCISGLYPFMDRKIYYKSMCLNVCYFKLLFKECDCAPQYMGGLEKYFSDLLQLNVSKYSHCKTVGTNFTQLECMKKALFKVFKSASPSEFCPECKEPCYVTKYSTLLTYRKFPVKKELHYYQQLLNVSMNLAEFRKNYLVVDFSFDEMTRLTVVEIQAITTGDVLIDGHLSMIGIHV